MPRGVCARAHQHPGAEPGENTRQFRRPAGPEDNAASGGELEGRHDEPLAQPSLSAGNTAEYLVEARGAAIIPATESRQAA